MITKTRIKQQKNKVLALNNKGQKVAAEVVGFDGDMALVKFRCMFKPVLKSLSELFEFPMLEDDEEYMEEVLPTYNIISDNADETSDAIDEDESEYKEGE